jgi:3,4-dihydroxy 2-butanone 4-phosphate synthase/GTP cyclohydrolase II
MKTGGYEFHSSESSDSFNPPGFQYLRERLRLADEFRRRMNRPFIAVSYAQSIDGSIALRDRRKVRLSGCQSMRLTHQIRAVCDAILVGIETVIADNPQLTVRLIEGRNPRPIVLDTHLRIPRTSLLIQRSDLSLWIVGSNQNSKDQITELSRTGATVLPCAVTSDGRIDLYALMKMLTEMKISSLMVEGGARVITSFINSKLVDLFIITISPKLVGGLAVIDDQGIKPALDLKLDRVSYQSLGEDLIMWAVPVWDSK